MSQNTQMLSLLRTAWPGGVHSHDLRREHGIGDPGKRASELREKGHDVYSVVERRGDRHGCRYFLRRHEFDAVPSSSAPSAGEGSGLRSLPKPSTEASPVGLGGAGAVPLAAPMPAAPPPSVAAGHPSDSLGARKSAAQPGANSSSLGAPGDPVEVTLDQMDQAREHVRQRVLELHGEGKTVPKVTLEAVALVAGRFAERQTELEVAA